MPSKCKNYWGVEVLPSAAEFFRRTGRKVWPSVGNTAWAVEQSDILGESRGEQVKSSLHWWPFDECLKHSRIHVTPPPPQVCFHWGIFLKPNTVTGDDVFILEHFTQMTDLFFFKVQRTIKVIYIKNNVLTTDVSSYHIFCICNLFLQQEKNVLEQL